MLTDISTGVCTDLRKRMGVGMCMDKSMDMFTGMPVRTCTVICVGMCTKHGCKYYAWACATGSAADAKATMPADGRGGGFDGTFDAPFDGPYDGSGPIPGRCGPLPPGCGPGGLPSMPSHAPQHAGLEGGEGACAGVEGEAEETKEELEIKGIFHQLDQLAEITTAY